MSADQNQPLQGHTVVITRAKEQQSEGRRLLQTLGATRGSMQSRTALQIIRLSVLVMFRGLVLAAE